MLPDFPFDDEVPFVPESPARKAWRELFGEPRRPTPEELQTWQRIEDAVEQVYPLIENGDLPGVLRIVHECPGLPQSVRADEVLRFAITCGQDDVVEALLQAGFPADRVDESGTTALMDAAGEAHAEMVRMLLHAGADANVLPEQHSRKIDVAEFGQSALYFALCRGDQALVDLLTPATTAEVRELAQRAYERWRDERPDEE